ncbi:phage scaffolding protein [Paenibacillus sinopodophylli]|uniref:phage scaffolding protein n=1 Tax=Paenibacillus sinopodophylli TaxID=1837342 RepID=UPI00110CD038|nr:phage scaffolding protein [Paenibacillus sinopodophylli]
MDWLKDLLKAQGLTDAQITAIVGGVETNYKGFVPEHRFKEVNDAKKVAEDGLKDRDKQLEDLKKSSGDSKALQEQITQLQTDNKAAADKYAADVKEIRLSSAIKQALQGNVHDPDIVATLLDKSKIELDDAGAVKGGLDDQVKALQTSKGFLFVDKDANKPGFKGFKPAESGGGGGKDDGEDYFGKMAAEAAKANEGAAKAQQNYFE